ncbi:uncharacterized protein LOC135384437 [Ornithodoros turicata]|uniref:uncharacterized protein LOC135384437 n=1 Tax=Ornithodoros turicata TaxID=34597 RepID=UPI003138ECAC
MENLKAKRASRRAQNTKIIRDATTLLATPNFTMEAVKSLKDRLEKSNGELDRINAQYEEFIPAAEAEAEFLAIAEYEDQAIGMISTLQAHYSRLQVQSESSRQRLLGQDATATNVTSQRSELRFKGPKLPVLKITPFDGDYGQWTSFWEQLKGTIHDNTGLSVSDKFHYLRLPLTGLAASAIAGLPTTASCYEDAIRLLREPFGDIKQIRQLHLQRIRNLPTVKSVHDVAGLRNLYDHVEVHMRSLETADVLTGAARGTGVTGKHEILDTRRVLT